MLIGQSGYETLNKYLIFKDDGIRSWREPQPASRIIVKNQYSDGRGNLIIMTHSIKILMFVPEEYNALRKSYLQIFLN